MSPLLDPGIFLRNWFSNTWNLFSCYRTRVYVSHLQRTTGKGLVYIC